jgi:YggT family protein
METLIPTISVGIYGLLRFYQMTLILRIYLSWFPSINLYSQPFFTLVKLTNPYLRLWRGVMPPIGPIDFSALLGFLVISFAEDVFAQWGGLR